jgi:hypothetical protein
LPGTPGRARPERGARRAQAEDQRVGDPARVAAVKDATAVGAGREQAGDRVAVLVEDPRVGVDA